MKIIIFLFSLSSMCLIMSTDGPEVYNTKEGQVDLAFDLTLGKMKGSSKEVNSTINVKADEVVFNIKVQSFAFQNALIEQQFKDVYMEVGKFPETSFIGKINGNVDFKSRSPQQVMVDGTLSMHGVSKRKQIPAIITVNGRNISVLSNFIVNASDYQINIPANYFTDQKDEIKVTLDVIYEK